MYRPLKNLDLNFRGPRIVHIPMDSCMTTALLYSKPPKSASAKHQKPEAALRSVLLRAVLSCPAIILIAAGGADALGVRPAAHWNNHCGSRALNLSRTRWAPIPGIGRVLWALNSSETESRGAADGPLRRNTPNEENNWGMDESIDVNAIRMEIMERAGNARREDSGGGDEWITINEDGPDDEVHKLREALAGSLGADVLGIDSSESGDTSRIQDTNVDIGKFIDEEFDKGADALKALAEELKAEQSVSSYADTMAEELAQMFKAEEEKAAKEINKRQGAVKEKLEKAKIDLEKAVADAEEARRAYEGDFILQLTSFRSKGLLRQAAFVGAVTIANQAVYQVILMAEDRGGSLVIALLGSIISAALVWFYGYRPFSLK